MIFADEFTMDRFPVGFDNWLLNLMCFCVIIAAVVHVWRSMQARPPMDEQLGTLRKEIYDNFVTNDELSSAIESMKEKIDDREDAADEFRRDLKKDIEHLDQKLSDRSSGIFDAIRSLGREVSHLEGRLAKTGRLPGAQP